MSCLKLAAVGLHIASQHIPGADGQGRDFNDFNPGAYVRSECNVQVGAFKNSQGNGAVYGAYVWEGRRWFIAAGAVHGYREAPVLPLGMAGVKFGPVRLGYIPKVGSGSAHVLHLMLEFGI